MTTDIPLCVDLDGTLVRTDTLAETLSKGFGENPIHALLATRHLRQGKAYFKDQTSKHAQIDASLLPYNQELIDYLKRQKSSRKIILVTGSNTRIASKVAAHIGLFDEIYASDEHNNLTSNNKQALLVEKFGVQGFDYIGNDIDDFPVWSSARHTLVVAKDRAFLEKVRKNFTVHKEFAYANASVHDWLKLVRIHQWSKNLLIFTPFLLDHRFSEPADFVITTIAFLAFSLLASTTYIVNDFLDIDADRKNTTKSRRALASGCISIWHALVTAGVLFALSIALCLLLPSLFVLLLGSYFVLTSLYSFYLKKIAMIDVCVLAALHTVRIIAGTVVINAAWSFWLLAFSMYFFLSLALAKRVSELENIKAEKKLNPSSRDYRVSDINILTSSGISAGFIAVLVIALYVNSEKVTKAYEIPEILWLICPLLLYWIGRVWMLTSRGLMHEDPIVFALTDRISLLIMLLITLVFFSAALFV